MKDKILTILDGIKESKYEYSKAKAKLNATYGMCVTKLDRAKVEWVEGELVTKVKSMNEILKEYYDSKNSFLPYQWGVWCTAWSRLRLRAAIQILGPDIRYCDTDSVFYVGDHEKEFEALRMELSKCGVEYPPMKLMDMCFWQSAYIEEITNKKD